MCDGFRTRPVLLETCSIVCGTGDEGNIDWKKANSRKKRGEGENADYSHKSVAVMAILVYFNLFIVSKVCRQG